MSFNTQGDPIESEYGGYYPDYSGPFSVDPGRGVSGEAAADRLQGIIEQGQAWPIWSADRAGGIDTGTYPQVGMYGKSMRDIALWVALREHDREAIIRLTNWEKGRPLHIDPLPERVSAAYSDILYGEEPEFVASSASDQDKMDEMSEETGLADELKRWCDISTSEGEVWWRAWTDMDASSWPLVAGHSRLNVLPLFVGRKIVATAFFDNILTQQLKVESQVHVIFWRHVEIHTVGYVRNLLYRGTVGELGQPMALTSIPETQDLDEDWHHGLPVMLAGRIPFKIGRDFRVGVSAYQGIRDLLMDLNEARTIMAENARLVLKARMIVPASAVDADGNFDAGQDTIVAEALDEEMAGKQGGPFAVLEYNFRADQLIQHKNELVMDIMSRVGLAEQYAAQSRSSGGEAFTGTALRTKLVPTVQSAQGVSRPYKREVPRMLTALALLSSLPLEKGGCGQQWSEPEGPHVQKLSNLLPDDPNEIVQRHVMAVQGEVESIQTAVEAIHEDDGWSDDDIEAEVARIRADRTIGPVFAESVAEVEKAEAAEEEAAAQKLEEQQAGGLDIPNVPPGGPGSAVETPQSLLGSQQPGARRPVDGQSPGKQAPKVTAGGRKK